MTKIQLRRDTASNWATNNPTPVSGEPCFETDTGKLKIGDGVTAYNNLPYQGDSGTTPTNMVTVDTDQTITGEKLFLRPDRSGEGLRIALGRETRHEMSISIGRGTNSDFTGGVIRFDSLAAKVVGLQQQDLDGTMKISSAGNVVSYAGGTTIIRNGSTWGGTTSGIRIPKKYDNPNPKVEIFGGSNAVDSSAGVDAKISLGYEGTGAWATRKGVFIETRATTNASDSGAKLWLGKVDRRSAIYPVSISEVGSCLNFETYVGDSTNATLSIQKSDVVYTDCYGVDHSLISGSGANTDLSNLSDTGSNNLVDNNCYDFNNPTNITVGASGTSYTMPITGLLLCSAISTAADSNFIQIQKSNQENLSITRAPLANSSITNSIRVKKGQNIIIKYGSIDNLTIKVCPCFPSSGGGSDDIIILDSDGMGLTVKAGTYTSGTNENVTEATTVTFPTDTHFKVGDFEGNEVMLSNEEYNQLAGELVSDQVGTASSVNNGLSGQSGSTGLVKKSASNGSVISTFQLIPEKGKGLYTTDTVNVYEDVEANIKWAYTGTNIFDTTSRTMELKLSVLHSDGTETLCGTKTESQPCQQTITINTDKTVSLSGSWYKTYSLSTTIPAKSMVDGDKLKFTVTYKDSTSADGIRQAEAIQPEISSNTITGTVNKIGFEDGMTEGTYMITKDYMNIWDLGYITMSDTVANKMDKWTKTNPQ